MDNLKKTNCNICGKELLFKVETYETNVGRGEEKTHTRLIPLDSNAGADERICYECKNDDNLLLKDMKDELMLSDKKKEEDIKKIREKYNDIIQGEIDKVEKIYNKKIELLNYIEKLDDLSEVDYYRIKNFIEDRSFYLFFKSGNENILKRLRNILLKNKDADKIMRDWKDSLHLPDISVYGGYRKLYNEKFDLNIIFTYFQMKELYLASAREENVSIGTYEQIQRIFDKYEKKD